MLDKDIHNARGELYHESYETPPPNHLVHERRFIVAYDDNFVIYLNKADHGPPHIHIVKRLSDQEELENWHQRRNGFQCTAPKEARFLIVDDLIHGTRVEPFPYTDPQTRRNGEAALSYPEKTVEGKNAKRKYSMNTIELEMARKFGNRHAHKCLEAWHKHLHRGEDHDTSKDIPVTDKVVSRYLEPWDSRYEHTNRPEKGTTSMGK